MKKFVAIFAVLMLLTCLAGCISNPVNLYTASKYYALAQEAEQSGNLERACMFYSRAYGNAELGHAKPRDKAYALYEFARLSGYLGRFDVAEKGFDDVIGLLAKSEEDTASLQAPTYSEHARLVFDDGRFADAVPLFQKAVSALDRLSTADKYPTDYAAFLDDYSAALKKSGQEVEGEAVGKHAAEIRQSHPEAPTKFARRIYKRANQALQPNAGAAPSADEALPPRG